MKPAHGVVPAVWYDTFLHYQSLQDILCRSHIRSRVFSSEHLYANFTD